MPHTRRQTTHLAVFAALPATALDRILDYVSRTSAFRALLCAASAERANGDITALAAATLERAVCDAVTHNLRESDVGLLLLRGEATSLSSADLGRDSAAEAVLSQRLAMLAHVERLEMRCVATADRDGRDTVERVVVVEGAEVWSAGRNDAGQGARRMAADVNALSRCVPPIRPPPDDAVVFVAAGGRHSAALTACGSLFMSGANECGQLGLGDLVPRNGWVPIVGNLGSKDGLRGGSEMTTRGEGRSRGARIAMVACGRQHTILLTGDGRVLACGANENGQCGIESKGTLDCNSVDISNCWRGADKRPSSLAALLAPPARSTHFAPVSGLSETDAEWMGGAVQVAAGFEHSVVLLGDGRVFSTGSNTRGQLGVRSHAGFRSRFERVDCYGHRVVRVGCGADTTMMLTCDNMVLVSGKRATGLSVIGGLGSSLVTQLSVGDGFALSRTKEGFVVESRFRKRFELNDDKLHLFSTNISAGVRHYAFVTEDGGAMACGFNAFGQVAAGQMGLTIQGGLDARIIRPHHVSLSRVAIPEGYRTLQVASGAFHTLYLVAPQAL